MGWISQTKCKKRSCRLYCISATPPANSCVCNYCPHMKRNTLEKIYLCRKLLSKPNEMLVYNGGLFKS
ncbi:MAG: hypothetical protein FJY16_01695 [Bacteroidetes bacterium]|nr:hypothetical protein [Bacteroidota bacterium]